MAENPENTYSTQHPGHDEPDRYLDDEGRCTFCGRALLEAENARLQAKVEEAEEVRRSSVNEVLREKEKVEERLRAAEALAERRKKALEPFGLCQDVRDKPAEYVTRDMAIDAGEPTMEGTMLRGVISEPCGNCDGCRARAAIEEEV